jgi:hypothetical protein
MRIDNKKSMIRIIRNRKQDDCDFICSAHNLRVSITYGVIRVAKFNLFEG